MFNATYLIPLFPRRVRSLNQLLDSRTIEIRLRAQLYMPMNLTAPFKQAIWIREFRSTNEPEFHPRTCSGSACKPCRDSPGRSRRPMPAPTRMRPLGLQVTTSEAGRVLFEPTLAHQEDRIPRASQRNETSSFLFDGLLPVRDFLEVCSNGSDKVRSRALSPSRPYSSHLENVTQTYHQTNLNNRTSSLSVMPARESRAHGHMNHWQSEYSPTTSC